MDRGQGPRRHKILQAAHFVFNDGAGGPSRCHLIEPRLPSGVDRGWERRFVFYGHPPAVFTLGLLVVSVPYPLSRPSL